MNWLVKVAAFKILSSLPGGAAMYRYAQEHLTHSLEPTPQRVGQKIKVGLQYWDWFAQQGLTPGSVHLDFGAGWHPTVPLLYYSLGVERQHLVDVGPLLERRWIEATTKMFLQLVTDPAWPERHRLKRLPAISGEKNISWQAILSQMGMHYHAPFDNSAKKIADSVDFATATQVLYFIKPEPLKGCFKQVNGVLKKGGKFLATVYLNDVNASWHGGLSQYNHLRYSPEVWDTWMSSRLMSYNRLKAADYRQYLEEAGFQIRHFDVTGPTATDLDELSRIPIHISFNRYSREELGAKHLFFVAEKV